MLAFITSDQGSENQPAMREIWNEKGKEGEQGKQRHVFIHCAAHALQLVHAHANDTLPGARKKAEVMSHRWVAWAEKISNLLRRKWAAFSVLTRFHAKWSKDMPIPPRGVRTRWLCIILIFQWLLPKLMIASSSA